MPIYPCTQGQYYRRSGSRAFRGGHLFWDTLYIHCIRLMFAEIGMARISSSSNNKRTPDTVRTKLEAIFHLTYIDMIFI